MRPAINEKEILDALGRLSPEAKRKALRQLLGDLEELDRIVDRNQEKLRTLCRERGLEFSRLSEEEREELIDQILHEE